MIPPAEDDQADQREQRAARSEIDPKRDGHPPSTPVLKSLPLVGERYHRGCKDGEVP